MNPHQHPSRTIQIACGQGQVFLVIKVIMEHKHTEIPVARGKNGL
jgi:hypothetical protein